MYMAGMYMYNVHGRRHVYVHVQCTWQAVAAVKHTDYKR